MKSLQTFVPPDQKSGILFIQITFLNFLPAKTSVWNHNQSTPYRSEANGIVENAVRRVKEGTSAILVLSGLSEKWWSEATEGFCYLRNIQDKLADRIPPYETRFGTPSDGPVTSLGTEIY